MEVKNVLMSYRYILSPFYSISTTVGSFGPLFFNKTPYFSIQVDLEIG